MTKGHYLHPPRNPLTETSPSFVGDSSIGHVTLAPHTRTNIKTEKQYKAIYQMQQCYSGFHGSDCCDIKEIKEPDKDSHLSHLKACLTYYGQSDLCAHVQQMLQSYKSTSFSLKYMMR
jgi:hypothetical protein